MAGEVKRSGFSDPANTNLTSETAAPTQTTTFQIDEWGLTTTGKPDELARINFNWFAPTTRDLTTTDALTDDVYDSGTLFGSLSGTYSTNDTTFTMEATATTSVIAADRVYIGADGIRYIVNSITSNVLTIEYGLLNDIVASGAELKLIEKIEECPSGSRQLRVNAQDGDPISVTAQFGTEELGWSVSSVEIAEWEDLNFITGIIDNDNLSYHVDYTTLTVEGNVVQGGVIIPMDSDPASQGIAVNSNFALGNEFSTYYTATIVTTSTVTINTTLSGSFASGSEVWLYQSGTFLEYPSMAIGDIESTKALTANEIGSYNLYYSSAVTSNTERGDLLKNILTTDSDYSVQTDGSLDYNFKASNAFFDGSTWYFSLTTLDTAASANESNADASAWVTCYPGQAEILSSILSGTDMEINYKNITATGTVIAALELNRHLYDEMGGATMSGTSPSGGYNVYLVDYAQLTNGSYAGATTATGYYYNSTILTDDIVIVQDVGIQRIWQVHAEEDGVVTLNNDSLTTGADVDDYFGAGAPTTANITAKYARVNRTTDLVNSVAYITDFVDTYVVSGLSTTVDQAVTIESVDTQIDSGKI